MSKKLYFLISFVSVLVLAGNVLAYDFVSWDNNDRGGDQLWRTATNWDIVGGSTADYKVPVAADSVGIDDWASPGGSDYPIIDANTSAVGRWIGLGELAASSTGAVMLEMTGGTLTAGSWFEMGGYYAGNFRFDISGGTLTAPYFWVGYTVNSYCTINISDGAINSLGYLSIGTFDTTEADLNMTGGDVNLGGRLDIGAWRTPRRGVGHVDLHGGTIETIQLRMGGGGVGTMDFAYDGTLIIDGDYRVPYRWLFDPLVDDPNNQGQHTGSIAILADRGIITAYGTQVGDIIGSSYPSVEGLRAVVNLDYNNINPGQTTITAGAVDPNLAWDPDPLFGSGDLFPLDINLISWAAGDNAVKHDVYFGTSFTEVNDANTASDPNIYRGRQLLADVNCPISVTWYTTYYWRIDEVNASDEPEWKGTVWNFVTRPAWARNPKPTGTGVSPLTIFTWDPGPVVADVCGHYFYLSTEVNDIRDRDPNVLEILDDPCYPPPEILPFSTQYFWAVDEVNNSEDPNVWPSPRWNFTTAGFLLVDGMEKYLSDEDMKAYNEGPWNDYWTTGVRSDVYIETRKVLSGNISMRFYYNNDKVAQEDRGYSEAWALAADLEAETNWNLIGIKLLAVNFRGLKTNTKPRPLYLVLSDGTNEGMVTYDDANSIQEDIWRTWWIILGDPCFTTGASPGPVDMNSIEKIWLGVGVRGSTVTQGTGGGEGDVYFDDIQLYPPICVSSLIETDISHGCIYGDCVTYGNAGDCITDMCDLDVMAGDWLEYDYNVPAAAITTGPVGWWRFDEGHPSDYAFDSAGDNDGTIVQASWVKDGGYPEPISGDPNGHSLHFDGDSVASFDHVICAIRDPESDGNKPGDYPAELMPSTFTAACWFRISEDAGTESENYYDTLVCAGVDEGEQSAKNCGFYLTTEDAWMSTDDRAVFIMGISTFDANGAAWEWYPRTPINYPTGTWYHFAATYDDANTVRLYVDGKLTTTSDVGGPLNWLYKGKFPPYFVIGGLPVENSSDWFFFDGNIDEVRLYNYAMSYGQIVTLAEQGPVVYHDMISPANFYDDEAKTFKKIDFKDYRILADHWLEGPILWPN